MFFNVCEFIEPNGNILSKEMISTPPYQLFLVNISVFLKQICFFCFFSFSTKRHTDCRKIVFVLELIIKQKIIYFFILMVPACCVERFGFGYFKSSQLELKSVQAVKKWHNFCLLAIISTRFYYLTISFEFFCLYFSLAVQRERECKNKQHTRMQAKNAVKCLTPKDNNHWQLFSFSLVHFFILFFFFTIPCFNSHFVYSFYFPSHSILTITQIITQNCHANGVRLICAPLGTSNSQKSCVCYKTKVQTCNTLNL